MFLDISCKYTFCFNITSDFFFFLLKYIIFRYISVSTRRDMNKLSCLYSIHVNFVNQCYMTREKRERKKAVAFPFAENLILALSFCPSVHLSMAENTKMLNLICSFNKSSGALSVSAFR